MSSPKRTAPATASALMRGAPPSVHVRVAEQVGWISTPRRPWCFGGQPEGLEHEADHGGIGDLAEHP